MPKATFTKDFVWKAKQNVRLVYKAGKTYGITTACYAQAKAADAIGSVEVAIKSRAGADGWMHHEHDDAGR